MTDHNEQKNSTNKVEHDSKNSSPSKFSRKNLIPAIAGLLVVGALIGGYYWYQTTKRVYTDKAEITAPLIVLGPETPDTLTELLVKNGEDVSEHQVVARLQNGLVRTKTAGTVVARSEEIGKLFNPGSPIVTLVNPKELHVTAHIPENKGLNLIKPGQRVIFTVDAFGSKEFVGTVTEVAKISDQSSVVFSISDKREEHEFSVKISYDTDAYPELTSGMSAKAWIYQ